MSLIVIALVAGGPQPSQARIDSALEIARAMTLEQRAGQILLSFPPSPDYAAKYWVGGVVVNQRHHIKSKQHMRQLADRYNQATEVPMIISCDQEGGKVNRMVHIPGYANAPSPVEMGKWPWDSVFNYALRVGQDMRSIGINTNLAPCLDVSATDKALMRKMRRVFSGNPDTVASKGLAFSAGCRKGGVLVIAKHFPGYGEERWNSDVSLVKYKVKPKRFLQDLMVFLRVSPQLDGVMMSSLIYPDYDPVPACFSRFTVDIAHKIMPWGLVITDDLWAPALRQFVKPDYKEAGFSSQDFELITQKAFRAGNDMLLILDDRRVPEMVRTISKMCKSEPQLEQQLNTSVARVLLAKDRLYPGLLSRLYQRFVVPKTQNTPQKEERKD